MKIPKQFSIKGKQWKVSFRKKVKHEDGEICRGLCVFGERRILLVKDMPEAERTEVFLHEMVHATLYEAHLSPGTGLASEAEEIVCDAITDTLLTCFRLSWRRRRK